MPFTKAARSKIHDAGIPYQVHPLELIGERVDGVLAVTYLVFTEGYAAWRIEVPEAPKLTSCLMRVRPGAFVTL